MRRSFMNFSRPASSSSRPLGGPSSALAYDSKYDGASGTTTPSGRSLAMTFQVARDAARRAFSQSSCVGPASAEASVSAGWRFSLFGPR